VSEAEEVVDIGLFGPPNRVAEKVAKLLRSWLMTPLGQHKQHQDEIQVDCFAWWVRSRF
jgi:hypothetical protein